MERASRDELLAIVKRYFDAQRQRRGASAPLADTCVRRENGIAATDNPQGPIVDADHPGFGVFAATCSTQLDIGYIASLSEVRHRPLVVDAANGLVLDLAYFDYSGAVRSVAVGGIGQVAVSVSFAAPITDIHVQLFKIESGKITRIEAAVRRVPYGQRAPWDEQ